MRELNGWEGTVIMDPRTGEIVTHYGIRDFAETQIPEAANPGQYGTQNNAPTTTQKGPAPIPGSTRIKRPAGYSEWSAKQPDPQPWTYRLVKWVADRLDPYCTPKKRLPKLTQRPVLTQGGRMRTMQTKIDRTAPRQATRQPLRRALRR